MKYTKRIPALWIPVLALAVSTLAVCSQFQPAAAQNVTLASAFSELLPSLDCSDLKDAAKVQAQGEAQTAFERLAQDASMNAENRAEFNKLAVEALRAGQPSLTQCWILRQLRWTATDAEIPVLVECLNSPVALVVDEAAASLVSLRTPAAKAALEKAAQKASGQLQIQLRSALTSLNEKALFLNDWAPDETVFPQELPYADKAEIDRWVATWDTLDVKEQIRTIASLAVLGDKSYVSYAEKAVSSDSEPLQRAGLCALETLGTSKQIPLLLAYPDRDLARRIAGRVVADGFDGALKLELEKASDFNQYIQIVGILTDRGVDVADEVIAAALKKDCANRVALLRLAAQQKGKEKTSVYVDILVLVPAGRDRDEAEKIIAEVTMGDASEVIKKRTAYPNENLYSCIGRIGGAAAQDVLNRAAAVASTRDDAIRGLCNWPNADGAENLFAISQDKNYDEGQRCAALRAYIRVVSLPNDKIGIRASDKEKFEMLKKAFDSAWRVDEKKLVLSRLSAVRCVESLNFAIQCIDVPELETDAVRAFADLVHHNDFRKANRDKVTPVMDRIIQNSKDQRMVERLTGYKNQP